MGIGSAQYLGFLEKYKKTFLETNIQELIRSQKTLDEELAFFASEGMANYLKLDKDNEKKVLDLLKHSDDSVMRLTNNPESKIAMMEALKTSLGKPKKSGDSKTPFKRLIESIIDKHDLYGTHSKNAAISALVELEKQHQKDDLGSNLREALLGIVNRYPELSKNHPEKIKIIDIALGYDYYPSADEPSQSLSIIKNLATENDDRIADVVVSKMVESNGTSDQDKRIRAKCLNLLTTLAENPNQKLLDTLNHIERVVHKEDIHKPLAAIKKQVTEFLENQHAPASTTLQKSSIADSAAQPTTQSTAKSVAQPTTTTTQAQSTTTLRDTYSQSLSKIKGNFERTKQMEIWQLEALINEAIKNNDNKIAIEALDFITTNLKDIQQKEAFNGLCLLINRILIKNQKLGDQFNDPIHRVLRGIINHLLYSALSTDLQRAFADHQSALIPKAKPVAASSVSTHTTASIASTTSIDSTKNTTQSPSPAPTQTNTTTTTQAQSTMTTPALSATVDPNAKKMEEKGNLDKKAEIYGAKTPEEDLGKIIQVTLDYILSTESKDYAVSAFNEKINKMMKTGGIDTIFRQAMLYKYAAKYILNKINDPKKQIELIARLNRYITSIEKTPGLETVVYEIANVYDTLLRSKNTTLENLKKEHSSISTMISRFSSTTIQSELSERIFEHFDKIGEYLNKTSEYTSSILLKEMKELVDTYQAHFFPSIKTEQQLLQPSTVNTADTRAAFLTTLSNTQQKESLEQQFLDTLSIGLEKNCSYFKEKQQAEAHKKFRDTLVVTEGKIKALDTSVNKIAHIRHFISSIENDSSIDNTQKAKHIQEALNLFKSTDIRPNNEEQIIICAYKFELLINDLRRQEEHGSKTLKSGLQQIALSGYTSISDSMSAYAQVMDAISLIPDHTGDKPNTAQAQILLDLAYANQSIKGTFESIQKIQSGLSLAMAESSTRNAATHQSTTQQKTSPTTSSSAHPQLPVGPENIRKIESAAKNGETFDALKAFAQQKTSQAGLTPDDSKKTIEESVALAAADYNPNNPVEARKNELGKTIRDGSEEINGASKKDRTNVIKKVLAAIIALVVGLVAIMLAGSQRKDSGLGI